MADPLSSAASIVGIAFPALQVIRLLSDDLHNIMEAPQTIQNLKADVSSARVAIQAIQAIEDLELEALGKPVVELVKVAIEHCAGACDSFRNDLQRWTKHSQSGKLSWQDRAKIGIFKEHQLRAMSEHLQSCKTTCNTAVGVATLQSTLRNSHTTEDTKDINPTLEAEIFETIQSTDNQKQEAARALSMVCSASSADEVDREDRSSSLRQIQDEETALDHMRKLLEELLWSTRETTLKATERTQEKTLSVTFGVNNKGFQAAIINGNVSNLSFGAG